MCYVLTVIRGILNIVTRKINLPERKTFNNFDASNNPLYFQTHA